MLCGRRTQLVFLFLVQVLVHGLYYVDRDL